jgi:hypothetical protein
MSDHQYVQFLSNWLHDTKDKDEFRTLSTEFNVCPLHPTKVAEKTYRHECQCQIKLELPDWDQTKTLSELVREWDSFLETMSTKDDLRIERSLWLRCYFKAYEMNNEILQKFNQEPEEIKNPENYDYPKEMTDSTIDELQYELTNFLSKTRSRRNQDYIANYCFMHHQVVNGFSTRHVSSYKLDCFLCQREVADENPVVIVEPFKKFRRII